MLRIAVVGATGAVGRECLALLDGGIVPVEQLTPVGSARSVGRDLAAELALSLPMTDVVTLDDLDPRGLDVAIFSAGAEVSAREAERLASAGVLVVDNSSAFRMRPDVPLVVPQVNPGALDDRPVSGLVANPNCSTIQLVRALHPLHELAGLESVVVATYQAASGGGVRGLRELAEGPGPFWTSPVRRAPPAGASGSRCPSTSSPR
ncbi:Asd/ArgC dimerization domain-containing protein [Streptomyces ossamyceticus]|uniref:aspartate-semialdehyde dehydrogenase n=1 Tax=Streptomyces ossamyceticus TaxID=249581 RepID=UPI0036EC33F9